MYDGIEGKLWKGAPIYVAVVPMNRNSWLHGATLGIATGWLELLIIEIQWHLIGNQYRNNERYREWARVYFLFYLLQYPWLSYIKKLHDIACLAFRYELLYTLRPRQMDAISQTTFSNAFSWMKMFEFRLKFHWSLFRRVQLTIFQQWFR